MGMSTHRTLLLACALLGAPSAWAAPVLESDPGAATERHLPGSDAFELWAQDPQRVRTEVGDHLEEREVLADQTETVKLTKLVPPIHFASGVADIPASTIASLRAILDGMRHLDNVRLHLIGHADTQPLSSGLAGIYGDNAGLSRERAGEVAEFIQTALALPPDAISFEWAGDTRPVATNASADGRARNRRVEVEVWYDRIGQRSAVEEVVVPAEIKRIKVCRMETVCKLRYREGHERRARLKNLIAPLRVAEDGVGVPEEFIEQIRQGLHNLRDRQNVTVRFIGFTDDLPLAGREESIYGTHLALSKARARRVALAVQEALELPDPAVSSDGRGSELPVASNRTVRGRALNRRIEVELWYDDPLQELPDEPQPCPDASGAELVTKVYDPPWGRIEPLQLEAGRATIPPGYTDALRRAMADIAGKTRVRLRFVGYTRNEGLERRTAGVYGDDVGLSVARARRAMTTLQEQMQLSSAQVEHEGRGFVHSNDVVNAGFIEEDSSYVVVEVVYDELAPLDDYEGVEITPITRELAARDPLGLNLMRITVDGEPIDDPDRSSADLQRCTDVALERSDIRFRFDALEAGRRLSVTSEPRTVRVSRDPGAGGVASSVRFQMYSNYPHFIQRSEVRVFAEGESVQAQPLAVIPVDGEGLAEWQPEVDRVDAPLRVVQFVLRAYDDAHHFDETAPQALWLVRGDPGEGRSHDAEAAAASEATASTPEQTAPAPRPVPDPLLAGYGESGALLRNIPLDGVGTVAVEGSGIPPQHSVWFAGYPVPVDAQGRFVAEAILPAGLHTVEVAVLDPAGNGALFLRDLELERSDWFYVGMADLTLAGNRTHGPADALVGDNAPRDYDSLADGRLAFYVRGRFGEDWGLTASADTREEPVEDLFTNLIDKSPDALFRRMDPDTHYPTFGDDGTVEENAPTSGKFYVKLNQRENHLMWGNFEVDYVANELAQVERGLYGANVHLESPSTTRYGERRLEVDGFAAEPGTVPSREEFRGTDGSLYFLKHQDLMIGSERLRIEVRDKTSGIVSRVVHLRSTQDYDIDYLQGRILLSEPVASVVEDGLVVRSEGLSGDEAWLVVQYEYTPGFDELDALSAGAQSQYWFNDFVKLGVTANRNEEGDSDSSLYGADLTLRLSSDSWLKLQAGRSEGLVSSSLRSDDGGFRFLGTTVPGLDEADANAYRADLSMGVADVFAGGSGQLSLYGQRLDAGYSGPGLNALTDTDQYGGLLRMPVTDRMQLAAKADASIQDGGLETSAQEVDAGYRLTERWSLSSGIRNDIREDRSPVVPVTQEEGTRTDAVAQLAYAPSSRWRSYGFAQTTLLTTGDREDNRRGGVGGAYRVSDRLLVDGEVSYGDLGPAGRVGTRFQQDERTQSYMSYAMGDEQGYSGLHERRGNLIAGTKSRLSDSASVYIESRYQHTDRMNGLTRTMGMTLAPAERWSLGGNWQHGTLVDRQTDAETRRRAGGARVGYHLDRLQLSSGAEYRFDETEQLDGTWSDRTTWLFRNSLRFQMTPDWRLVGKFNHAFSDSSLGQFYDGGFTEGVLGYAYRPVKHDRLNALAKYTYFYNVPTTEQVTLSNTPAEYIQKSHIASLDVSYDLTRIWTLGGKYAYRLGQISLDREDRNFFDNDAHLLILRNDLRFLKDWEGSVEGRMLDMPDLDQRRSGALVALYRYLGEHFKVGVGYNFTDFSEDLTDLSYDDHGWFFNLVGML
jgi:flagellar motor protein MotB